MQDLLMFSMSSLSWHGHRWFKMMLWFASFSASCIFLRIQDMNRIQFPEVLSSLGMVPRQWEDGWPQRSVKAPSFQQKQKREAKIETRAAHMSQPKKFQHDWSICWKYPLPQWISTLTTPLFKQKGIYLPFYLFLDINHGTREAKSNENH